MSNPEKPKDLPVDNRPAVDVLPRHVLPDGTVIVYGAAPLPPKPDPETLDRLLDTVRARRSVGLVVASGVDQTSLAVVEAAGSTMSQSPTNEAGFTIVSGPGGAVSADAIRAGIAMRRGLGEEL
ncbi:MAG: hypothetical protein WBP26_03585 [Candidatus Saccharimonadales bacterium]